MKANKKPPTKQKSPKNKIPKTKPTGREKKSISGFSITRIVCRLLQKGQI